MMITSTCASTNALQRSLSFGRVPMAAPTSSCLFRSLLASGNSRDFLRSVRLIRATISPAKSSVVVVVVVSVRVVVRVRVSAVT